MEALHSITQRSTTSPSLFTELVTYRKIACLRTMPIRYLDISALRMAEALLANDPRMPDFPPVAAMWLQPLGPLFFRRALIRGLTLYHLFAPEAIDALIQERRKQPMLHALSSDAFERLVRKQLAGQERNWLVEMVLEPRAQVEEWGNWGEVLLPCGYDGDGHRWEFNPEALEGCPTRECTVERLGEESVYVPCAECQRELDWLGRWLKTMFWLMEGRFRRPADTTQFETSTEQLVADVSGGTPPAERGKKQKKERLPRTRTYHTMRIAFDASYFLPEKKAAQEHTSRYKTHLVLTTEEALREGALEVDLAGVLIQDWSTVRGHWRCKPGKDDKIYINPKEHRRQLVSLATWKARQQQRERHEIQKIIASAYSQAKAPES